MLHSEHGEPDNLVVVRAVEMEWRGYLFRVVVAKLDASGVILKIASCCSRFSLQVVPRLFSQSISVLTAMQFYFRNDAS